MKIGEIMTQKVGSCRPDQSTYDAARLMWECDCGCVPVIDQDEKVVGMITDRDICMSAMMTGRRLSEILIDECMSHDPQCCTYEDSVEAAEEVMRLHQIRRLPVVDKEGKLRGVLSLRDLAIESGHGGKQIEPEEVSTTLKAICQNV